MLKTQQQLINDGYTALLNSLGPIETIRFLQYFQPGQGDYTQERHSRIDPSLDTIFEQMQSLPAPDPEKYEEII